MPRSKPPKVPVAETYMVIKVTDPNKADDKIEFKVVACIGIQG